MTEDRSSGEYKITRVKSREGKGGGGDTFEVCNEAYTTCNYIGEMGFYVSKSGLFHACHQK